MVQAMIASEIECIAVTLCAPLSVQAYHTLYRPRNPSFLTVLTMTSVMLQYLSLPPPTPCACIAATRFQSASPTVI